MILYHGTNTAFETIDLKKSKPNKDFGQGFYLSADYEQAMAMAKTKVEQLEYGTPIVLAFEIDEKLMDKLNIKMFDVVSDYRYIFVSRNYVFYRIEDKYIRKINLYHEKEDFMWQLFGIDTTPQDTIDYWDE